MDIKIKGHSGCSIEIITKENKLYVEKGTTDVKYINRLYAQSMKQIKAAEQNYQFIRIPKIENIEKTDSKMILRMEYIYSKNFIEHFESAGFEQISYFINAFTEFIKYEIESSNLESVSSSIVINKFKEVKQNISANTHLKNNKEIKSILSHSEIFVHELPEFITIPIGICHGDLTLSNILFNGNSYYLIDFLDSFIESPLMDMVKLRQDTAFQWSTLMFLERYDITRLKIISKKIDQELVTYFNKFKWYNEYYKTFQIINFLRILQYAREKKVIDFLNNSLKQLLEL